MSPTVKQLRLTLYLFGAFCAGYELARFSEIVGQGPMLVHAESPVVIASR